MNDSSSKWTERSHDVCGVLWAKKNHFKTHVEFTLCLFLCVFLETVSDFVALILALNSWPSYVSILSSGIMDVDLLIL